MESGARSCFVSVGIVVRYTQEITIFALFTMDV